ncbi:MAG: hypothetical protein H6Q76_409 [Firmicutes bacterium]|nr:hypothetical protein [Bacillota bacterium]
MDEIRWLKISLDMFDNEKIKFIRSLPEADAIIVIWVGLLVLAGKSNAGGYIILAESLPYTEDMLANDFHKPKNVIRLAIETFRQLRMIEQEDGVFYIKNWLKYQNVEGMELVKLQSRARSKNYRVRQKQRLLEIQAPRKTESNVADHVTRHVMHHEEITPHHAIELELEDKTNTKLTHAREPKDVDNFIDKLVKNGICVKANDRETINNWLLTYTADELNQAIMRAVKGKNHKGKYVSYLAAILQNMKLPKPKQENRQHVVPVQSIPITARDDLHDNPQKLQNPELARFLNLGHKTSAEAAEDLAKICAAKMSASTEK